MTPRELSQSLSREAESICRELLPNGKKQGSEWCVGSVMGEEGKSLCVRLTGTKAGVWSDFADKDKGGDLLDLYAQTQGTTIAEAIKWAKARLGIPETRFSGHKQTFARPQRPKCTAPKSKVLEWLKSERKLSVQAIEAYKLSEHEEDVIFPYLRNGELVRWKARNIHDKHKCQTSKDSEPCLFGWQAIPDSLREVVICEGELDAPSWWMMGYPALSVPNGAQGHSWIEFEYDNLERFDKIYLSMDMDEAGQKSIPEISDRLGRERVLVVKLPAPWKDANEIVKHIDLPDASKWISQAKTLDPDELKDAHHYRDKVFDIFTGKNTEDAGYFTPWRKVQSRFRFRPGELTILAGENFHGKSEGTGHIVVDCKHQGAKCCVASMEYKPEKWIANIAQQASAIPRADIADGYANAVIDWVEENLWVFDTRQGEKTGLIIKTFEYARRRYGIDFFVIDNLQKCGIGDDDYNAQKFFAEHLSDFARDHHVHVILVHHLNKSNDENPRSKSSVKGSGGITDMANNVIIWWRNVKKERTIEEQAIEGEVDPAVLNKCDAMMIVDKQRETGDTPRIKLWFDKNSRQFLGNKDDRPKTYVRYSGAAGARA